MNDSLALIVSGISIAGSVGAVFFFKKKYETMTEEIKEKAKKLAQNAVNANNSSKVESIKILEEELSECKNHLADLNKQYTESIEQNTFYQNQIISLREELSVSNKNEAAELNNAYQTIQSLQKREVELSTIVNNQESNIHKQQQAIIDLESEISLVKNSLNESNLLIEKLNHNDLLNNAVEENNPKSILVVDDSSVIRIAMKQLLNKAGYDVTLAKDGLDALEIIPTKKWDMIITDLEMPNLDGFGLLVKLNENEDTKNIPVIVITGHQDIHIDVNNSENLFGIYKKPWKEAKLLQKVKTISSIKQ